MLVNKRKFLKATNAYQKTADKTLEAEEAEEDETEEMEDDAGKVKRQTSKLNQKAVVDPVAGVRGKADLPTSQGNIIMEDGSHLASADTPEYKARCQQEKAKALKAKIEKASTDWFKENRGQKFDNARIDLVARNSKFKRNGKMYGSLPHVVESKFYFNL